MDPAALLSYDGRQAVAEIANARGELLGYAFERSRELPPPCLWGCVLRKLAGARQGTAYLVRLWPHEQWSCTCPDWQYRNRARRGTRTRGAPCKHILAAQAIRALLASL